MLRQSVEAGEVRWGRDPLFVGQSTVFVRVIWVVAVPVVVRVVLKPADDVGVVAVFDAGVGRGVVKGIWVVAVPVVVRVVLEPANVIKVLAVSIVVPWHEG